MNREREEWIAVAKKDGVVWIDGVRKAKPPKWTKRIPDGWTGIVCLTAKVVKTYASDYRQLGAFSRNV